MSIRELNRIKHCTLANVIAAHNNQLGKTAGALQQFRYQLAFVKTAPDCIKTLEQSPLRAALTEAYEAKKSAMPDYFNQLLHSEPSLRRQFLANQGMLDFDEAAGKNTLIEALTTLNRLKAFIHKGDIQALDETALLSAFEKLNRSDYLPKLIKTSRYHLDGIKNLNALLSPIAPHTLCPAKKSGTQADIATGIVSRFYLKELQGFHAEMARSIETLSPLLKGLYSTSELNDLYIRSDAFKNASRKHVSWWQGFFKTCKRFPQS